MNCEHGPKFRNQHWCCRASYRSFLLCFLLLPANLPWASRINEPHFTGCGSISCHNTSAKDRVSSLIISFCFLLALGPRETCGSNWVCWCTPLIPALGRQNQVDLFKFNASLAYTSNFQDSQGSVVWQALYTAFVWARVTHWSKHTRRLGWQN